MPWCPSASSVSRHCSTKHGCRRHHWESNQQELCPLLLLHHQRGLYPRQVGERERERERERGRWEGRRARKSEGTREGREVESFIVSICSKLLFQGSVVSSWPPQYQCVHIWDFVGLEPSGAYSPQRRESIHDSQIHHRTISVYPANAFDSRLWGDYKYHLFQVRRNLKNTFQVGDLQSPFSISSFFILELIFALLPFSLKSKVTSSLCAFQIRC